MIIASLLFIAASRSVPLNGSINSAALYPDMIAPSSATFSRDIPECLKQGSYRSTPQIVWTCLATIFACTWVAIHPNLPGPYDSGFQRFRRRTTIAFVAIIAPELIAIRAATQLDSARKIKDEFNKRFNNGIKGWTLTHGFFIQMGGFMMYHEDKPVQVLTWNRLLAAIERGEIDVPQVPEEDITDKSKGDGLTKLVVVLQTTWFVAQCIGRASMHLPLAELEVLTLAFAALNVYVYSLWWSKPQGVLVPIRLPFKTTPTSPSPSPSSSSSDHDSKNAHPSQTENPRKPLLAVSEDKGSLHCWSKIVIFSCFVIPLVFGGIHLILWSTSFHTPLEQLLWRTSAIYITAAPLVTSGFLLLCSWTAGGNRRLLQLFSALAGVFGLFCVFAYSVFRFILLFISFYTLTHLPEGVYHDIQWSDFFPHI
ncbi:hypothetical protein AN958_01593 [Leucoagaricus sp. SymC.cos]|nr:hypothetical protein AN958_01593 [Leucoagaricus sp. SymC.cos]